MLWLIADFPAFSSTVVVTAVANAAVVAADFPASDTISTFALLL